MALKRRLVLSGGVAAALYIAFVLVVLGRLGADVPAGWLAVALLAWAIIPFLIGAFLFGLIPHLLGNFMAEGNSALDFVNRASLAIALISIAVGVVSALAMIGGAKAAGKPLLVAITFFLGAAATMCSLKFFYINRAQE